MTGGFHRECGGVGLLGPEGVVAPAATPQPILTRYHSLLTEILGQASVREVLSKQGLDVKSGSPQQFADLIAEDLARWARVVRDANIAQE